MRLRELFGWNKKESLKPPSGPHAAPEYQAGAWMDLKYIYNRLNFHDCDCDLVPEVFPVDDPRW